jgi:hypothetical protein
MASVPLDPAAGRLSPKLTKPVAVLLELLPEPVVLLPPLPEFVLPLFVLPGLVPPEVVLPVLVLGAVLVPVPLLLVLLLPVLLPPPQADSAIDITTEITAALLLPLIPRLRKFLVHPKFPGDT